MAKNTSNLDVASRERSRAPRTRGRGDPSINHDALEFDKEDAARTVTARRANRVTGTNQLQRGSGAVPTA